MVKLKEFIQRIKTFINENPQRKKLLLIIFILAVIPITVIAALTVQDLRQRAGGTGVQIVDVNGNFLSTTSDTQIYLRINLPENWVSLGMEINKHNFINQAYAQTAQCSPPYQGFLGCFSFSNQPSGSVCTSSCITDDGQSGEWCYTSTTVGNSCTNSAGQSGVCNEQDTCVATAYSTPVYFTPTQSETATPTPTISPIPTTPPATPTSPTSGISPTSGPTPTPIPNILQGIYIENKDSDDSSNGSEPLRITSGFESYINTSTPWRLNDLLPGQNQAVRIVQVTLFSNTGESITLNTSVTLVWPNVPTNGTQLRPPVSITAIKLKSNFFKDDKQANSIAEGNTYEQKLEYLFASPKDDLVNTLSFEYKIGSAVRQLGYPPFRYTISRAEDIYKYDFYGLYLFQRKHGHVENNFITKEIIILLDNELYEREKKTSNLLSNTPFHVIFGST